MNSSKNQTLEFSSAGSAIINSSSSSPSGTFGAIQFLKDSTIDAITAPKVTNPELLADSFIAGTVLYGEFTGVSISSGLVALHRF
jgi:hypothetical protein